MFTMAQLTNSKKIVLLIAAIALFVNTANAQKSFCSEEEQLKAPCLCCKMRCWYNTQQQAKNVLGHMPGTRGEGEAVATLSNMSTCMASFCSGLCTASPRRQMLLAALNKEMKTK